MIERKQTQMAGYRKEILNDIVNCCSDYSKEDNHYKMKIKYNPYYNFCTFDNLDSITLET